MPRFALIGSSGYVAPRHLRAIRSNGGDLLAALDPHDAAGVLDGFFPEAAFFTEFERFDRHLEKLKRKGQAIDYVSICSPNYLHDAHCRYGLRHGADVVCEKPLVLHPHNLEALRDMERETGRRVWNVLQLRHHPQIVALKEQSERQPQGKIFDVELTYVTPRGKWYYASWKGEPSKSGGIITNIGIHLFDMLLWVFGPLRHAELHLHTHGRAAGFLQLERARVRWFLSIENLLAEGAEGEQSGMPEPPQGGGTAVGHPRSVISSTQPRRTLLLDGHAWDFSEGFTDLHTECYAQVLAGRGWSTEDAAAGIELTWQLRQMPAALSAEGMHPWVAWPTQPHPFYAP